MNVYDFDKTIYDGDSSIDFYLYSLKRNPLILVTFPVQILGFILYFLKIYNKEKLKEKFFTFLRLIKNIDNYINDFWLNNDKKIKKWYLFQKKEDDIIISASPEFLLKPLIEKLKIGNVIATKVNKNTGKFESKNCYGLEKVKRFKKLYGNKIINSFYTDSIKADKNMIKYSKESYIINGDIIKKYIP